MNLSKVLLLKLTYFSISNCVLTICFRPIISGNMFVLLQPHRYNFAISNKLASNIYIPIMKSFKVRETSCFEIKNENKVQTLSKTSASLYSRKRGGWGFRDKTKFHNVKAGFEVHSSPDLNSRCQGKGSRRPWEVSQSGHKRQTGRSQGSKKERVKGMYNQAMELALHRNSGCQWQGWYQNAAQDLSRPWTPDRQIKDWWVHPRQKLTIEQMDQSLLTTLEVKHDGRISEVFLVPKLR